MNEAELTPDEKRFVQYRDLKKTARDAELEAKNIKEEIEMAMADGVQLSFNDEYLAWQYETRIDFDTESAMSCGDLSEEVYKRHLKVNPIRKLVFKKKADEEKKAIGQQKLLREANAAAIYSMLELVARDVEEEGVLENNSPRIEQLKRLLKDFTG